VCRGARVYVKTPRLVVLGWPQRVLSSLSWFRARTLVREARTRDKDSIERGSLWHRRRHYSIPASTDCATSQDAPRGAPSLSLRTSRVSYFSVGLPGPLHLSENFPWLLSLVSPGRVPLPYPAQVRPELSDWSHPVTSRSQHLRERNKVPIEQSAHLEPLGWHCARPMTTTIRSSIYDCLHGRLWYERLFQGAVSQASWRCSLE